MGQHPDEDRIRRKAHELWQAEGHPHGRDIDHWEQAREIIAIEDSQGSTLLPRETGAEAPVESSELRESQGDVPGLTDQGEHDLTAVSRESGASSPAPVMGMTSGEIMAQARVKQPAPDKASGKSAKRAATISAANVATQPDVSIKTEKSGSKKKK